MLKLGVYCNAARTGQLEVVQMIMNQIDDKNPHLFGVTPLHLAAYAGQLEVVKTIMAEIEVKNPEEKTG